MKTNIIKWFASLLMVSAVSFAGAQTTDELLQLSTQDVQGTARFSGMGGAFNALGGDFGSLSVNPAGIATYRSSEFTITPTITSNKTKTDFLNTSTSQNRTRFGLANVGYVATVMTGKTTGLVSFNFGLGYNKTANFYKKAEANGYGSRNSVVDMYADYANRYNLNANYLNNEYFDDILPEDWSTAIAYGTSLIDYDDANKRYYPNGIDNGDMFDINRYSYQTGSSGEYVASFGGNISNKFQFGISVGLQDIEYVNGISYTEYAAANNTGLYDIGMKDEYTRTVGSGINTKLGVILRPVDQLRIGLAVHSPTWFSLEREYDVYVGSQFLDETSASGEQTPSDLYKYKLQTPYKIEAGLAFVIGKYGLVSFDYEYVGNNGMRIRDNVWYDLGYINERNDKIKNAYKGTSNIRIGAEVNLPYALMLRGGYNYFQSPYDDSSLDFDRNAYSFGFGYRNKNFFIDFAYTLNTGNYHYVPYYVNDYRVIDADTNPQIAVEKESIGKFMATIGFKF